MNVHAHTRVDTVFYPQRVSRNVRLKHTRQEDVTLGSKNASIVTEIYVETKRPPAALLVMLAANWCPHCSKRAELIEGSMTEDSAFQAANFDLAVIDCDDPVYEQVPHSVSLERDEEDRGWTKWATYDVIKHLLKAESGGSAVQVRAYPTFAVVTATGVRQLTGEVGSKRSDMVSLCSKMKAMLSSGTDLAGGSTPTAVRVTDFMTREYGVPLLSGGGSARRTTLLDATATGNTLVFGFTSSASPPSVRSIATVDLRGGGDKMTVTHFTDTHSYADAWRSVTKGALRPFSPAAQAWWRDNAFDAYRSSSH